MTRFGINRVNQYSFRSNDQQFKGDPIERVFQEGGAETSTLLFPVNGCSGTRRRRTY
jgi:hypothetical protein